MADWNSTRKAVDKPLPPPNNIIHEVKYRGRRIVLTDDRNLVGSSYPDKWGFAPTQGYIVLDEFDEVIFPVGMHWFYTPDDAAMAIEMLDTIYPQIKDRNPATTLLHEYGVMRAYRREFWHTYGALQDIRKLVDDARAFEENPLEDIAQRLHFLRQQVAQGRSVG